MYFYYIFIFNLSEKKGFVLLLVWNNFLNFNIKEEEFLIFEDLTLVQLIYLNKILILQNKISKFD